MPLDDQLLNIEEQFWKAGADFYRQHLTDDALMAFAEPAGVLTRDTAIQAISTSPRWSAVSFQEVHVLQPTADTAILSYQATAHREGKASSYSARVASIYVNRDGAWKLIFHQQTPSGSPDRKRE